jgi:Transposase DDE domain group 1
VTEMSAFLESKPVRGEYRAARRPSRLRGTAEQWIKDGKTATHWTRLSCHRFRANKVPLLLGVIAYNLGNLLRRLVLPVAIQSWSRTSLQQRLFKTGGRLIRHARYFTLQLVESYLTGSLFRQILQRIEQLTCNVIGRTAQAESRVGAGRESPQRAVSSRKRRDQQRSRRHNEAVTSGAGGQHGSEGVTSPRQCEPRKNMGSQIANTG